LNPRQNKKRPRVKLARSASSSPVRTAEGFLKRSPFLLHLHLANSTDLNPRQNKKTSAGKACAERTKQQGRALLHAPTFKITVRKNLPYTNLCISFFGFYYINTFQVSI
jgi:hypothetical protein